MVEYNGRIVKQADWSREKLRQGGFLEMLDFVEEVDSVQDDQLIISGQSVTPDSLFWFWEKTECIRLVNPSKPVGILSLNFR